MSFSSFLLCCIKLESNQRRTGLRLSSIFIYLSFEELKLRKGEEEMTSANIWVDFGILGRSHGERDVTL